MIVDACMPYGEDKLRPVQLSAFPAAPARPNPNDPTQPGAFVSLAGAFPSPPQPLTATPYEVTPIAAPVLGTRDAFQVPKSAALMITSWSWGAVAFQAPTDSNVSPIPAGTRVMTAADWASWVASAAWYGASVGMPNALLTQPMFARMVTGVQNEEQAERAQPVGSFQLFGAPYIEHPVRWLVPGSAGTAAGLFLALTGVLGGTFADNFAPSGFTTNYYYLGTSYTLSGYLILDREILDSRRGQMIT